MPPFKLGAIARDGTPRPVVVVDNKLIDVQDAIKANNISAPSVEGRLDVLPMLDDWDNWLPVLHKIADANKPFRLAAVSYVSKDFAKALTSGNGMENMASWVRTRASRFFAASRAFISFSSLPAMASDISFNPPLPEARTIPR